MQSGSKEDDVAGYEGGLEPVIHSGELGIPVKKTFRWKCALVER